jgi:acyl-CoA synthetase (AMP-forming)/AMP-acid ligase II
MIIGDILEHNAVCFGSQPAIYFEGETLTHMQLADRVKRLISALAEAGIPRQARLAVLSRNTPEYLEVYGAAGLGGFIGLGINYRLSDREQLAICKMPSRRFCSSKMSLSPGSMYYAPNFQTQ